MAGSGRKTPLTTEKAGSGEARSSSDGRCCVRALVSVEAIVFRACISRFHLWVRGSSFMGYSSGFMICGFEFRLFLFIGWAL